MKVVKTAAIISLLTIFCAGYANAWSKKDQRFLWGAAVGLTLPHMLVHRHHNSYYGSTYTDRHHYNYNYNRGRHYAPAVVNTPPVVVQVEQPKPQIIYVEMDTSVPMHRKVKPHNYIHGSSAQPLRVIVEDGTATIIER
ncbi:MAG: YrzE family protein [Campylobacteraceae bacterium]|jgi:hypothetical protein|nr:YrzE family protein [Campylobacteraceae bacterium]